MSRLTRWLAPTTTARAHCDIPCGIYDPARGRRSALGPSPGWSSSSAASTAPTSQAMNTFTRCVRVKEDHAELVKRRGPGHLVRLLQAGAPREVPRPPRQGLEACSSSPARTSRRSMPRPQRSSRPRSRSSPTSSGRPRRSRPAPDSRSGAALAGRSAEHPEAPRYRSRMTRRLCTLSDRPNPTDPVTGRAR